MTRYGYPTSAMLGDYARSAAGLVPAATVLAVAQVGAVGMVALSGFAALFAVFGIRTLVRHGTRLEISEEAVSASGLWRSSISWGELDRMRLAYYSTRRDRRAGWMQLELGSGRTKLRLDSRLEGFTQLVERSARAAAARRLELNEATVANLEALGVRLPWGGEGA
jgi:hypothetical protein